MYIKVFYALAFVAVARGHDVLQGTNNTRARNFYDARFQASPAIWKQTKDLFINASEHEVISKIKITDLREDKNGDVEIVSGGVGYNNVSITLKSPTILRGYDFLVQVYAVLDEMETQNRSTDSSTTGETSDATEDKLHSKVPSDVTHDEPSTGNPDALTTEPGKTTTEGLTVTYPTKPTTEGAESVSTGKPTDKEVVMPEPTVTDKPTEVGNEESEVPVEVEQPLEKIDFRPPRREH